MKSRHRGFTNIVHLKTKGLILFFLVVITIGVVRPQSQYLDDMYPDQLCVYIGQLALLMSQVYIYQGKEPKIVNKTREPTEFEKQIMQKTKKRVEELIQGENGIRLPHRVRDKIYSECLKSSPISL